MSLVDSLYNSLDTNGKFVKKSITLNLAKFYLLSKIRYLLHSIRIDYTPFGKSISILIRVFVLCLGVEISRKNEVRIRILRYSRILLILSAT